MANQDKRKNSGRNNEGTFQNDRDRAREAGEKGGRS